ncbi:uncharacterized protein [Fopius arisanus]|uniref:Uncharacterized protein n=1 Tax=Fopius arisanus TaxID=64838 RepID=A0A9R1T7Y4_9HYME|nr:PREDICTED: uncharacterized protein LOC105267153 [Fopius arisanus]
MAEVSKGNGSGDAKLRTSKTSSSDSKDEEDRSPTVARIRVTNSLSQDSDSETRRQSASRMSRIFLLSSNRSPQSSSSQEEYEPDSTKRLPGATLGVNGGHQVGARSMESLQRGCRNFLSADERYGEDSRSLESLTTQTGASTSNTTGLTLGTGVKSHHHYRSFLSCSSASSSSSFTSKRRIGMASESRSSENLMRREESLNAEVRRGLYASTALERKAPRLHLSLPQDDDPLSSGPPSVFSLTSPGGSDRRITILSPHSPLPHGDVQHNYSIQSLRARRNKALVLPRLVLPRSESEVFLQ